MAEAERGSEGIDGFGEQLAPASGHGLAFRDQLLALALSQPGQAIAEATRILGASPTRWTASVAHQAVANVHRDRGDFGEARRHYRRAAAAARGSGDGDRVAEVLASAGAALVMAGNTRPGLARLGLARRTAQTPATTARVGYLLGATLLTLGRHAEAGTILDEVLATFRDGGERLWWARALLARSCSACAAGATNAAVADARQAHQVFVELGQSFEAAAALRNIGGILAAAGNIPEALAALDEAEAAFARLGPVPVGVSQDRVAALAAARLLPEARELAEQVAATDVPAPARAELLLVAAESAFAVGDLDGAASLAGDAEAILRAQSRGAWVARARLVRLRARSASADLSDAEARQVMTALRREGRRLDAGGFAEGRQAHLFAGRLAVRLGDRATALHEFGAAAAATWHSPFDRATGALAEALAAHVRADPGAVLRSCRRGLDALDEQRSALGDLELAALATGHARELSELAVQVAARRGARSLLGWVERTRATTLHTAPLRPSEDPDLARLRAAARDASRRLAEATDPGVAARIVRERDRLEAEARRRRHVVAGARALDEGGAAVGAHVVAAVGQDALLSLVDVEGLLTAVLVHAGRVTRHEIGRTEVAVREADYARFALRRAAYGRRGDLAPIAARAEHALLVGLGRRLPQRVTVVPPAVLHTVPWSLLPSLEGRVVAVSPSARLWLRARGGGPREGHEVFVGGPALSSQEREILDESARYAAARVLTGDRATAARVVAALDGAGLAHVAAHGTFRADAPLFSALRLHDGPLHLHDLDRIERPPHTLVLSACDVGDVSAVGADEGLGLVTGLLGLGCAAVLAPAVPVNDAATIVVMRALHARLAMGASLPEAAAGARAAVRADPTAAVTAAAFTAWGA